MHNLIVIGQNIFFQEQCLLVQRCIHLKQWGGLILKISQIRRVLFVKLVLLCFDLSVNLLNFSLSDQSLDFLLSWRPKICIKIVFQLSQSLVLINICIIKFIYIACIIIRHQINIFRREFIIFSLILEACWTLGNLAGVH